MSARPSAGKVRPRRIPVQCHGPSRLARGRRPVAPPIAPLAPLPTSETAAWSRGLWGRFLPDRRQRPRPQTDAAA